MTHIKAIHDDGVAICGEILTNDFHFKTIDAAVLNGMHDASIKACKQCTQKLLASLLRGVGEEPWLKKEND